MNRAKKLLMVLLLINAAACAMNDEDDHCAQVMEKLDLDRQDFQDATQQEEDRLPYIMAYCCSRNDGLKPMREVFLQAKQRKKKFFSAAFISRVLGNAHSREWNHDSGVFSVAFDRSGERLATGCRDGKARIFDTKTGVCVGKFYHGNEVDSVAFDTSGKLLATGCDTTNGRSVHARDHDDVNSIACDPSGKWLVTGDDNAARIYDSTTGAWVCALDHGGSVQSVAFDPSGKQLATGCTDGKARIFKLKILELVHDILTLPENMEQLYLLQACELAMQEEQYVHVTDEEWATFKTLPELMQKALCKYIVTGEQYKRIKKITG